MDTALVFVANIPFRIYYNTLALPTHTPRYRTLVINEDEGVITISCLDANGGEVMPYPEYILALFTYLFEVRGRYKHFLKVQCIDGTHECRFYVDSVHKYGVNVDLCKQLLTYKAKMPDYTELDVADYEGYDTIRLLYVDNLDCFSLDALSRLRFLHSGKNSQRTVAFTYMDALRYFSEPSCDLFGEMLTAIAHRLRMLGRVNASARICYYPCEVKLLDSGVVYYAYSVAGNSLDTKIKM